MGNQVLIPNANPKTVPNMREWFPLAIGLFASTRSTIKFENYLIFITHDKKDKSDFQTRFANLHGRQDGRDENWKLEQSSRKDFYSHSVFLYILLEKPVEDLMFERVIPTKLSFGFE